MCADTSDLSVLSVKERSAVSIGGGHVKDVDGSDLRMAVMVGAGTPSTTLACWCLGRRSTIVVGKKQG